MFTLLGMLVRWVVQVATKFLPLSPIQTMTLGDGVQQGLGWFNWLMPMGDMLSLMDVWLLALLAWRLYRFVTAWTSGVFELAGES